MVYPLIIISLTVVHFVGAIDLPPNHKERWTTLDILYTVRRASPHQSTTCVHALDLGHATQLCATCLDDSCCDPNTEVGHSCHLKSCVIVEIRFCYRFVFLTRGKSLHNMYFLLLELCLFFCYPNGFPLSPTIFI